MDKCPVCENADYEYDDEIHFVFYCKKFEKLRENNVLFSTSLAVRKDLAAILSSSDEDVLINVAKYIAEAMKVRKNILKVD